MSRGRWHGGRARTVQEILIYLKANTTYTDDKHWLCKIKVNSVGYSTIKFNGKNVGVHRFIAYVCLGLNLSSDKQANHRQTCSHKNCWNPLHIYVGTASQNIKDARKAGTFVSGWGLYRK